MADSLTLKMRGLAVSSSSSQHVSSGGGHHGLHTSSKLDRATSTTATTTTTSSASLPRITPVVTKYRNPDLGGRHDPATSMVGSSGHHNNQDAPRAALMRLAGGAPNFDRTAASASVSAAGPSNSNLTKMGSPKRLIGQHPAHGIHGPAHGTAARTLASKIVPAESKKAPIPINSIQTSVVRDLVVEKRTLDVAVEGSRMSSVKDVARKSDSELEMPFKA
jgi:hypothetical protein